MIGEDRVDGLSVRYRHGDRAQRREFARRLAAFVRSHRDRWDIATFLYALDLLGRDVADIRLTLRREPDGRLAVTIGYDLAPVHPAGPGDTPAPGWR